MERSAAFYIGKNFKKYIFAIITELPFSWHSDNHSGETINKINKATQALEQFSDDNFIYTQTMVRFIGSLVGISLISWYMGLAAMFAGVTIIGIILLFDKRLIPQYREIFDRESKVASLLHDYVSNIRTVITLHFEALAKHELVSKIERIFPIKKQNFILNELKWFSTNMFIDILVFSIILSYGYYQLEANGVILAGNLVILYQYLERFSGSFYSFAWSYEKIVKMHAELQIIDPIIEQHMNLPKTIHTRKYDSWNSIFIKNWNFSYGAR
jgi:ABC-type multidrug transport system fused ATPase/permease subunit